jgi:predicted ATP-dependent protease
MPKDLRSKISSLVRDIEKMNQYDKISAIERFVQNELQDDGSSPHLSFNAVAQIHSTAARVMRDHLTRDSRSMERCLREYPELVRTICYIQATYEYLRQEKMISYLLSFGRPNGKGF